MPQARAASSSPLSRPVASKSPFRVGLGLWRGVFPGEVRAKGSSHGRGEEGGGVCVEATSHRRELHRVGFEYPVKVFGGDKVESVVLFQGFEVGGEGGGEVTFRVG